MRELDITIDSTTKENSFQKVKRNSKSLVLEKAKPGFIFRMEELFPLGKR
jgi:hypothetical protein